MTLNIYNPVNEDGRPWIYSRILYLEISLRLLSLFHNFLSQLTLSLYHKEERLGPGDYTKIAMKFMTLELQGLLWLRVLNTVIGGEVPTVSAKAPSSSKTKSQVYALSFMKGLSSLSTTRTGVLRRKLPLLPSSHIVWCFTELSPCNILPRKHRKSFFVLCVFQLGQTLSFIGLFTNPFIFDVL